MKGNKELSRFFGGLRICDRAAFECKSRSCSLERANISTASCMGEQGFETTWWRVVVQQRRDDGRWGRLSHSPCAYPGGLIFHGHERLHASVL
jgi:hypothetical protein